MKSFVLALLTFLTFSVSSNLFAQNVAINSTGSNPDTSAMLDVSSTTNGFLLPRMTTVQRDAIVLPANALIVYNTTINAFQVNTGTTVSPVWTTLGSGSGSVTSIATGYGLSGGPITSAGTLIVDTLSLSNWYIRKKDSTGNTGFTTVYQNSLKQNQLNGTGFVKATGSTISYDNSTYLTGNQTITFTPTGDVTGTASGTTSLTPALTIGNTVVTNAKLANMATQTFKGRTTAGSGSPEDLTATQATAMLNLFGTSTAIKGLVPGTPSSTTNFLRADGTWAVPSTTNQWSTTGNTGTTAASNFIGTTDNKGFRIKGNSIQGLLVDSLGNVAVGKAPVFAAGAAREKFLVDAGTTTSINAISAKGSIDNYFQLNIQNQSAGVAASSDIVATSNNGTETTNFVDMGINGSGNSSNIFGNANDAYLYNQGENFFIGNSTSGKSLILMTGGTDSATNERMRISGTGNVGIANPAPSEKLDVTGNVKFSGALMPNNIPGTAGSFLTSNGAGASPTWTSGISGTNTGDVTIGTANGLSLSAQVLSLGLAGVSTTGALSSTDWNTFNSKLSAIDTTNITNFSGKVRSLFSGTAPITYSNGLIGITQATTSTNGYLSSTDWNTFNNKANAASGWSITGNTATNSGINFLGTRDNTSLKFRTNNIQQMKIDSTGNIAIGQDVFDAINPEKLVVNAGTTTSVNAIVAKGSIDSYLQFNIKNQSTGTNATTDIVATADNGTETVNYVDLGINGSGYTGSAIQTGVANDGYLISAGNDFYMVNSSANKSMLFLTGGTGVANERMRILANGRVGMGVQNPTAPFVVKDTMEIRRVGSLSQLLFTNTSGSGDFRIGGDGGDIFWQGGGGRGLQMGSYWTTILTGDRQTTVYPAFSNTPNGTGVLVLGSRDASVPLAIQANSGSQTANLTDWRNSSGTILSALDKNANLGLGNSAPKSTLDVSGSAGYAITTTTTNITLDATNYTVILTGGTPGVTFPTAASSTRRIYIIVNESGTARGTSSYKDLSGATATTINTSSSITIQSDGTNWYQIR